MDKSQLLALDNLSGSSLKAIRTANSDLFAAIQTFVAGRSKTFIRSNREKMSSKLSGYMVDFVLPLGEVMDRGLQTVVSQYLKAKMAPAIDTEVIREADKLVLSLDGNGLFKEFTDFNRPVKSQALFQQPLQQATIVKLAAFANLPDPKIQQLIPRIICLNLINDSLLATLVRDHVLEEQEAKSFGLTVTLYFLADERLDVTEALKKGEFSSIPGRKLTQISDLNKLKPNEMLTVLERAQVQPPAGFDRPAYATLLNKKITNLFPTDAFLTNALSKDTQQVETLLDQLQPVFERNPVVFGRTFDSLDFEGIGNLSDLRNAHSQLQRLANLHHGLRVNDIFNAKTTSVEKARILTERIISGDRIWKQNPTVNLLALNYSPESPDLGYFAGLPADQRPLAIANFKLHQRAFTLTNDVWDAQTVLEAGYHSSAAIASGSFESFRKNTGLPENVARKYYESARSKVAAATTLVASLVDLRQGGFEALKVSNTSTAIEDYLKKLDGFAALFGNLDYCQCEHCQSILSPAAYFVDLMKFVEDHVLNEVFTGNKSNHVLNLKVRRPDLWKLPLTCRNTNETLPYLDIINKILENYIATQNGFAGDLEDRAAVEKFVYQQKLSEAKRSFRQPFFLPTERLDTYLSHFERSRAFVARTMPASAPVLAAATLKISKPEYTLIIEPKKDLAFLRDLYGVQFNLQAGGIINPLDAQEMSKFTGLNRDELGKLVATRFVNPNPAQKVEIKAEKSSAGSVQNDVERIYNLTLDALDRLHRFTRLWRRLSWSVPELDLVLAHFGKANLANDINADALKNLVTILALRERWSLSVEETCALWSEMPQDIIAPNQRSLFDRLFNLPAFVLKDDALPKNNQKFIHPSFRLSGQVFPADNTLNRLLAGLQVNDEQLVQLITQLKSALGIRLDTNNEDDRGFNLTVENLTLLYRHARLAQLLQLAIPDLFQLIRLAGIADGCIKSLADLDTLVQNYDWWKSSGFSLDDLCFITHAQALQRNTYPNASEIAQKIVAAIQVEKSLQFADTVFAFLPGVTEDQSRSLIAANLDTVFKQTPDGAAYRLRKEFTENTQLTIPAGIGVNPADAKNLLLKYHASQVLPSKITAALSLSFEKVHALLQMIGANLFEPNLVQELHDGATANLATLLNQLLPLTVLFRNQVFDAGALKFALDHKRIFRIGDFNKITMESVKWLSVYVDFADTAKQASYTPVIDVVDPKTIQQVLIAFSLIDFEFPKEQFPALASILHTDQALIATLQANMAKTAFAIPALAKLQRGVELAQYLGVDGETLKLIASEDYERLARASEAVHSAFRAKYPNENEFLEKFEPFEDRIRSRRRDALVDFIIRSMPQAFSTRNELYEYFLIDVQLEGCARTSHVVAAISSVQLYVHRCLMNLEQDRRDPADPNRVHVLPELIPAGEWAWRKNYRVWEANRKVFLYPENYIEPELRDDKTPLFEALESTLLQQQINEQNVLDAYAAYLSGFEEIAKLKIAGSYHDRHPESETDILHLFGVFPGDPPVYYYRTVENAYYGETADDRGVVYSPWRKIDVQIPVRKVAPIVYLGRLFVFWVQVTSSFQNKVEGGNSTFIGYKHKMKLHYTVLRLDGSWTPPQSVLLPPYPGLEPVPDLEIFSYGEGVVYDCLREEPAELKGMPKYDTKVHLEPIDDYSLKGFQWDQVYPVIDEAGAFILVGRNFLMRATVDFYRKEIVFNIKIHNAHIPATSVVLCSRNNGATRQLYYGMQCEFKLDDYAQRTIVADERQLDAYSISWDSTGLSEDLKVGLYAEAMARLNTSDEICIINGKLYDSDGKLLPGAIADAIIDSNGDLLLLQGSVRSARNYLLKRLGTTLSEKMSRTLFTGGVDILLDIKTQRDLKEARLPISILGHIENASNAGKLDFTGPFGTYYREMFFHIPSLIANHLNSQQNFAAAQRWYHYIFNPTASETIDVSAIPSPAERAKKQRDRVWRYLEFRDLDIPKLRAILTDPAAIAVYKQDPFNPHAIARLRLSAYQKCIVMKYIDNLLDWGDNLFAQFTMESVNEATLLYVMAADILGPRPAKLGECGEGKISPKSYEKIAPLIKNDSELLIEVETMLANASGLSKAQGKSSNAPSHVLDRSSAGFLTRTSASAHTDHSADTGIARPYGWKKTRIGNWTTSKDKAVRLIEQDSPLIGDAEHIAAFGMSVISQISPVFCVPENKDLRQYWDRVDDRLYKIRHCMDISGARRQLALFAPEIDPRLLVRAKAAGLTIEEVLNVTSGNLPPYRFVYLIEKAKQYAAMLQGFGAALLSALEKRDIEELNRLRTVQQQNLLKLTTRLREWEISIAKDTITTLERQQAAVQYRKNYYQGLKDEGLIPWENTQGIARHTAWVMHTLGAAQNIYAGVAFLIPQYGSPFAMKYGGKEWGDSKRSWADVFKETAQFAESSGASAGLIAGFQRREEGWVHQVELADRELNQLEKQLTAAQLRKEIAIRSLEIHKKTIEQTEEVFEFYRDRFTNLGLYTWLATTLQRVFREAYNSAYAMACLAEQSFRFERGDDTTPLLQESYWEASKAGFLAGERLLIDLQNMERRFIETNYRTLEIDQAFSLTQVDSKALINLRENGTCEFSIPEVFFDLFYPGQYRRKIKSVRLTIPCVTGPYTNVGATLKLTSSKLRKEPKLGIANLVEVPLRHSVVIATSTAQNDSGVFEFSFRDERYMPFEGAGAVNSSWKLDLPKNFRPFDYQTINDVIIHISYTAVEDEKFRTEVEQVENQLEGTILDYIAKKSLARVISLRQDFSSALNRLLHSALDTPAKIQITNQYLPVFLRSRTIKVTKAILALKTRDGQAAGNFKIAINDDIEQGGFAKDADIGNLYTKDLGDLFAAGIVREHTLVVKDAGDFAPAALPPGDQSALDSDKLLDIMLYFEYQVQVQ